MMVAVNTIQIQKGKGEEVASRFAQPKSVYTFEGFIRTEVWMKEDSPEYDELKVCTTWEERRFFDNWLGSRESQKAHGSGNGRQASSEPSPILGNELTTFTVKA